MTEKLLPCPFCGTEPYFSQPVVGSKWFEVSCNGDDCGAMGPSYPDKDKAVAAWNTRPFSPGAIATAVVAEMVRQAPQPQMGVAEGTRHLNIVDGKIYVFVSEADGLVAFKREGRETLRYLSRDEFDKRFFTLVQGSDTTTSNAMLDVLIERHRQVMTEGWTPEHDDAHTDYSLSKAAAIYAVGATFDGPDRSVMDTHGAAGTPGWMKDLWPWDIKWWKPSDRRRDLVKAAALILAEIERLDRAAISEGNQ